MTTWKWPLLNPQQVDKCFCAGSYSNIFMIMFIFPLLSLSWKTDEIYSFETLLYAQMHLNHFIITVKMSARINFKTVHCVEYRGKNKGLILILSNYTRRKLFCYTLSQSSLIINYGSISASYLTEQGSQTLFKK